MPICKTCNKFSSIDTDECLNVLVVIQASGVRSSEQTSLATLGFYGVGFAIIMAIPWAIFT